MFRRTLLSLIPVSLLPSNAKAKEEPKKGLDQIKHPPKPPELPDACYQIKPLAVTTTLYDVTSGGTVVHRCNGEEVKVGIAMGDAHAGQNVVVVLENVDVSGAVTGAR